MNDSNILSFFTSILKKELEKPEWNEYILKPILISLLPYILGVICLNFFMTIMAITLVLYINHRV